MNGPFEYLAWRGDLSFSRDALNEVDAALFAWLSYYEFGNLMEAGVAIEGMTLKELERAHERRFGPIRPLTPSTTFIPDLAAAWTLHLAAKTERFGEVRITDFNELLDPESDTQFSAVTFLTPEAAVLAYRGTDMTVTGWKEDCNLCFEEQVPSQRLAAEYLNGTEAEGPLWVVGHSKGGNLAVYAALRAEPAVADRVAHVYNFDGPGFLHGTVSAERVAALRPKLHTYVPEMSVVGMLLDHDEQYTVVRTGSSSILQHDVILWQVMGNRFRTLRGRNIFSRVTDSTLQEWLGGMTLDERREMVNIVFTVVESSGIRRFTDFSENSLRKGHRALMGMRALPPEQKKLAMRMLAELVRGGRAAFRESLNAAVESEP